MSPSAAWGGPSRPFEPCRVPSRRRRPWACGERMCVSASRFTAGVASVWAESSPWGNAALRPRSRRPLASAWPPFAKLGEFEEGQMAQL